MLIKIMTNRNSEHIIEGIEAVDIHRGTFCFSSDSEMNDTISKGPGVFQATGNTPFEIERVDTKIDSEERLAGQPSYLFKFVDYKKNGAWHRLAVECFAYVCNDEGKTISKVATE